MADILHCFSILKGVGKECERKESKGMTEIKERKKEDNRRIDKSDHSSLNFNEHFC
jgi:hypothetical protein